MCNQQPSLVKSLCKAFTPTATVSGLGHIILSLYSSCNSMDTPQQIASFLVHFFGGSRLMTRYCPDSPEWDWFSTFHSNSFLLFLFMCHIDPLESTFLLFLFLPLFTLLPYWGNIHTHTSKSYPSSVENFKTCPVPWSLLWFSPFLPPFPLPPSRSPSSLKSHNILFLANLCHLCLSYIYFLPIFYSLHFKFLDNKI